MKLTKKTYLTTEADKLIDRSFSEISKKQTNITVSSFFRMYKEIFYRIPRKGINSHTTLYNDSGLYIENPQTNTKVKIEKLNKRILELNNKLSKLEHQNEMLKSSNAVQELEIKNLKS